MTGRVKARAKSALRALFVGGQRLGFNVLPKHYYSQIPDIASLRMEQHWRSPFSMVGVRGAAIETQVAALDAFCADTAADIPATIYDDACRINAQGGGYGYIEAHFLDCFVRKVMPRKVVQIGCGVSTSVMVEALSRIGHSAEIVCVEPYPSQFLLNLSAEGRIQLIKEKAQHVALENLVDLLPGDLLFIDSTHTVKPGSEVNRIILDVLPRLQKDVWIHFHDVFFPYDYPRNILSDDLFFWSESSLLHAFLIHNARVRIELSLSMIHYAAPELLKKWFPSYTPQAGQFGLSSEGEGHFPSSIYLRVDRDVLSCD